MEHDLCKHAPKSSRNEAVDDGLGKQAHSFGHEKHNVLGVHARCDTLCLVRHELAWPPLDMLCVP